MTRTYDYMGNVAVSISDSMADFVDWMKSAPFVVDDIDYRCGRLPDTAWDGITRMETYAAAERPTEYLRALPKGILRDIKKASEGVISDTMRQTISYGAQGFMPCVPRALSGHPVSMYSFKKVEKKGLTTRVIINAGVACIVSNRAFQEALSKVVQAFLMSRRQGARCELYMADVTSYPFARPEGGYTLPYSFIAIKLLSSSQPFEVSHLAPIFSPAFTRYLLYEAQAKRDLHCIKDAGKGRVETGLFKRFPHILGVGKAISIDVARVISEEWTPEVIAEMIQKA